MVFIGIDNGITGSIGIIDKEEQAHYIPMPIIRTLNYQKSSEKYIHRIDVKKLKELLKPYVLEIQEDNTYKVIPAIALIERPMVNPTRFIATTSALRALEAVLITLEDLGIGYQYIDSKEWQKKLLPYVSFSKDEYSKKIKELSLQRAKQIFPNLDYKLFKDGDGILIAWYAKLNIKGT